MSAEPRRRWGLHELDSRWARRLVAAAGIRPGHLVVDVGAGWGAITAELVDAGARVVAVELHPRRAAHLQEHFAGADVVVARADATDLRLPRRPFRVVANPPFAITTSLLRRLLAPGSRLERADLVVPAHVARRWSAGSAPGAGRWRTDFDVMVGSHVPRRAFRPAAPMDVAVLVVRRK